MIVSINTVSLRISFIGRKRRRRKNQEVFSNASKINKKIKNKLDFSSYQRVMSRRCLENVEKKNYRVCFSTVNKMAWMNVINKILLEIFIDPTIFLCNEVIFYFFCLFCFYM